MNSRAKTEILTLMQNCPPYVPNGISDGDYHRFMDSILHESGSFSNSDWQALSAKGISLGNASCYLLYITAESTLEQPWSLYRHRLISPLVMELLGENRWYYMTEADGALVLLLCFQFALTQEERNDLSRKLQAQCRQVIELCRERYEIKISVYISDYIFNSAQISNSVQCINNRMAYRKFLGSHVDVEFISVNDLKRSSIFSVQQFAERTARETVQYLKERDSALMDLSDYHLQILANLEPKDIPVLKENYKYMVEHIYAMVLEEGLLSPDDLSFEQVVDQYLLLVFDWADICRCYKEFIRKLAEQYRQNLNGTKEQSVMYVLPYLRRNYRKADLTVEEIAAEVGMKPSTLCAAYKRFHKVTIFQTLKKLRLQEACRLLRETDLPLSQVSQRAGFGSMESMFRAFHKQMGTTPGGYRQAHPQ